MNVYLVQHAEAKSEQEDPQRSLTEKGWADTRKVAAYLADHASMRVKVIFHSGKTRAQQTAEALAEKLFPTKGVNQADGLAPLDDPSIWAKRLSEGEQDLILVGHLPYMSKLCALLVSGDANKKVVEFQMGGVVCLGRGDDGSWGVRWMVIPNIL